MLPQRQHFQLDPTKRGLASRIAARRDNASGEPGPRRQLVGLVVKLCSLEAGREQSEVRDMTTGDGQERC